MIKTDETWKIMDPYTQILSGISDGFDYDRSTKYLLGYRLASIIKTSPMDVIARLFSSIIIEDVKVESFGTVDIQLLEDYKIILIVPNEKRVKLKGTCPYDVGYIPDNVKPVVKKRNIKNDKRREYINQSKYILDIIREEKDKYLRGDKTSKYLEAISIAMVFLESHTSRRDIFNVNSSKEDVERLFSILSNCNPDTYELDNIDDMFKIFTGTHIYKYINRLHEYFMFYLYHTV